MNSTLIAFFGWLLRTSWQASILVLVVVSVQWVFRRQLSARWRHALWLLVLLRLILPSMPSSPASVFNYARFDTMKARSMPLLATPKSSPPPASPLAQHETPSIVPPRKIVLISLVAPLSVHSGTTVDGHESASAIQTQLHSALDWRSKLPTFAALVWLAGAMFTACRLLLQNFRFHAQVKSAKVVVSPAILLLFEHCRRQSAVRRRVLLVETAQVRSPALYGLFRPKLLFPAGMIDRFGTDELRHVFLHELIHVKRWDVLASWLIALDGILHWFNPVLRFGFRRMAGDRELACDEAVLTQVGEHERARYGEMILKVLEFYAHSCAVPGLVGILEDQSPLKRRIARIASFGQRRNRPVLAAALLIVIALVTFTDAQTPAVSGNEAQNSAGNANSDNASPLSASALTQKGLAEEQTHHDLTNALQSYRAAVAAYDHDRQQAAVALFHQAEILRQLGKTDEANELYRRILRDFTDQKEFAALSLKNLRNLSVPPPAFALSIEDVLYPGGVAVDSKGDIYVSDTRRDVIKKFDAKGTLLSQLGGHGNTPGLLNYPQGLAIGPGDCLYVADVENQRIEKFGGDGKFIIAWGEEGAGNGMFNRPYNIAVDKVGNVYVVDSDNNRIQKFTGDGAFLKEFGPVGGNGQQLKSPQGVAVGGDGNVYVGDGSNGRIVKYNPDGAYLTEWESAADPENPGIQNAAMNGHPFVHGGYIHDVAADAQGHVYAVCAGTECVQMFSSAGTLLSEWGSRGTESGQFEFVARVAVDPDGRKVYVTDADNNRAQVFAFPPDAR